MLLLIVDELKLEKKKKYLMENFPWWPIRALSCMFSVEIMYVDRNNVPFMANIEL